MSQTKMSRLALCCFYIFLFVQNALGETRKHSRQKRCIVIQKQSGTHGDSTEGTADDEEDYKTPMPKNPKPKPKVDTRKVRPLGAVDLGDRDDVEEFSPELQKFRKRLDRLRRKKIF